MPPPPLQSVSGGGEAQEVVVSEGMTVAELAEVLKTTPCTFVWVHAQCRVQYVHMLLLQGRSLKWHRPKERELTDILLVHTIYLSRDHLTPVVSPSLFMTTCPSWSLPPSS